MFDAIGALIGDILGSLEPMDSHCKLLDDNNPPMTTKQKVLAIALLIFAGFVALAVALIIYSMSQQ